MVLPQSGKQMLDGIIVGFSPESIRVYYRNRWVKPAAIDNCFHVEHPDTGRKLTLGFKNGKFILKVNPVGWLTGQNFFGTNNAHLLVISVLKTLIKNRDLRIQKDVWQSVLAGEYDIHQMAYNMYLRVDDHSKLELTDYLKTVFGGVASHLSHKLGQQFFLYSGAGFILKTRTQTLTVYDKVVEQQVKSKVVPGNISSLLQDQLRVESTVKYGYFSKSKRRMSSWIKTDWDRAARKLILDTVGVFNLEYLATCPNVFAPNYTSAWSDRDKALFKLWLSGVDIPSRDSGRLRRVRGFSTQFSVDAHKNTLHTLSRRRKSTVAAFTTQALPGLVLLQSILPIKDHLSVVATPEILSCIAKKCEL